MAKNERMTNDERRQQLLDGAIRIIKSDGWDAVTRDAVAGECKVAVGTVNFAYGTIDELRNAVYRHAIDNHSDEDMLRVLAAGLVAGNQVAKSAPAKVKQAAFALMM